MSDFQLTPPTLGAGIGYRPPPISLGDFSLRLGEQAGWHGLFPLQAAPVALFPSPTALDALLGPRIAPLAPLLSAPNPPPPASWLPQLAARLDADTLRALVEALQGKLWADITVPGRTKVANGDPATIGNRAPDGTPHYDAPDSVVPGMGLPASGAVWAGTDALGWTRSYRFNTFKSIKVGVLLDTDAVTAGRLGLAVSGASLTLPAPFVRGGEIKLVGGRDQTGSAAMGGTVSFSW